jgi:hypothetical protein
MMYLRKVPEVRRSTLKVACFRSTHRPTRDRVAQDPFESRIPAISAMRTRSDKLAACILSMRLAR